MVHGQMVMISDFGDCSPENCCRTCYLYKNLCELVHINVETASEPHRSIGSFCVNYCAGQILEFKKYVLISKRYHYSGAVEFFLI